MKKDITIRITAYFLFRQSKKDILARNDGSAELVNFRLSCFCACHVLNWATEFIHILHMSPFMGALRFSSWETTFSFWKLSTKITSSRRWSLGWETFSLGKLLAHNCSWVLVLRGDNFLFSIASLKVLLPKSNPPISYLRLRAAKSSPMEQSFDIWRLAPHR